MFHGRKLLSIVAALSLTGTLLATASGTRAAAPAASRTIIIAAGSAPTVLDPHYSVAATSKEIVEQAFDELVTYNESYKIIPDLATSWKIKNKGRTWVFELAHPIRFQDNELMTSADVVASIERYMAIGSGSANLDSLVSSVKATGKYEVTFNLKTPDLNLTPTLAATTTLISIMPAKYAKTHTQLQPPDLIGTGPYRITEWVPQQYTILQRFKGYTPPNHLKATGFGGDRPAHVDTLKYQAVLDPQTRLAGLLAGTYDYAESLPISDYSTLQHSKVAQPWVIAPNAHVAFYLNQNEPPLNNVWLRRALVAALDDTSICKFMGNNNKHFYLPDSSLAFPQQKAWYDPAAGKGIYNVHNKAVVAQDLKKAGYHGEQILILTNHDYPYMFDAALSASQQWQADGINAQLDVMTWSAQLGYLTKTTGWNVWTTSNAVRFDPSDYAINIGTGGSLAFGFSSPQIDAVFADLRSTASLSGRKKVYQRLQRLVWEQVPFIQIGNLNGLDGSSRKGMKGYRPWYIARYWLIQ